jgi:cyclohexyl-isocyanide hydratase
VAVRGTHDRVHDDSNFVVQLDQVRGSLDDFDLMVVPGGKGVDLLSGDKSFFDWMRGWGDKKPVASVCSGSLLLGELGWLAGLPATTHPSRFDLLRPYCSEVVTDRRVVDAGRVVTAGGVTCGVELGLHLVRRFWGTDAAMRIARRMVAPYGLQPV